MPQTVKSLSLNLRNISDRYTRDNFKKLEDAFNDLVFASGDFKFYEFTIKGNQDGYKLYHNLGFIPNDILVTKAIGSAFEFDYTDSNDKYLTVNTTGDLYLRCFIGNMRGQEINGPSAFQNIEDQSGTGGAGGGNITFYDPPHRLVDGALLTTRKMVIGHAPLSGSVTLALNGLILSDGYTISQNIITFDNSVELFLGDELIVRYAA